MVTRCTSWAYVAAVLLLTGVSTAPAKYSGGTGEPNNPYQIATFEDLIALGETPEDYGKHFILTADIDLDPNLPDRKVFDRAVIAPDTEPLKVGYQGTVFTGVFDGRGHTISHVTIKGQYFLGLFGQLASWSAPAGDVKNLGVVNVNIVGSGGYIGGLVGENYYKGSVSQCYSTGTVSGNYFVGGLIGSGSATHCYSTGAVNGTRSVGGLIGSGSATHCYSAGAVSGTWSVGGLIGSGWATACIWDIETSGLSGSRGGGAGLTTAEMMDPYMLGLNGFGNDPNWVLDAGREYPRLAWQGTSGQIIPSPKIDWLEGVGTPSAPYRIDKADQLILLGKASILWDKNFILGADIDLDPNLPAGRVFAHALIPAFSGVFGGNGHTISHLTIQGGSSLGLFGQLWSGAEVKNLGVVDASITGSGGLIGGLVGENYYNGTVTQCYSTGAVSGPEMVGALVGWNYGSVTHCYSTAIISGNSNVGGLVGGNGGTVTQCYSTGMVAGEFDVGGLVGRNNGEATNCCSTSTVSGDSSVGGLVGYNGGETRWFMEPSAGTVTNCYSTGMVSGNHLVGGLVGYNGGAEGENYISPAPGGTVTDCYSSGLVNGTDRVGGLVGSNTDGWGTEGYVTQSFWDTQTSSQTTSAGGTGKTTAQMQTAKTFLDAEWDFVGETANGSEDVWKIAEGLGYPRLSWEKYSGGTGEPNDPYQIATAADLITLGETPEDYGKHFILTADIDLDPNLPDRKVFDRAVIAPITINDWGRGWDTTGTPFTGVFDGHGHTISHLTIKGKGYVGLFGCLLWPAEVRNLGVVDVNTTGSTGVGGLVGFNGETDADGCFSEGGLVIQCYSTGAVSGDLYVGGLVGWNSNEDMIPISMTQCYSTATVRGDYGVGGLVGENEGVVTQCHSTGVVSGDIYVGALVGKNGGRVTQCYSSGAVSGRKSVGGLAGVSWGGVDQCYSTGAVRGTEDVGGLVGEPHGSVTNCYSTGAVTGTGQNVGGLVGSNYQGRVVACFWDTETSGQTASAVGTGKTTAEMQTAKTFLDAGWDFVGETFNGTEDTWWIDEGKDYPHLWWETTDE